MSRTDTTTGGASPYELWVQANGDRERYLELMREHGHILRPGDDGYEDASPGLPCGWPGGDDEAELRRVPMRPLTDAEEAADIW